MRTTVLLAAAAAALVCGANAAIHASAGGGDRLEPEPQSLAEVVASRLTLPACFWTRTCGSTPRPATSPPRVTGRAATTVRPAATDGCEGLGGNPRPDAQTISQAEWNLFERGVKALRAKASRRFSGYSVYEEFTRVHRENALHRGASFLMWHRVMLFEFEKELNIAVPGARIPAFDWSQWSRNLLSSSVFSSARMGTSMSSGRFSGWSSRNGAVRRQINTRTALHSRGMIDSAIGVAGGYPGFNNWLEGVHNNFHVAMGGDMLDLNLSPNDPMFYLHHAFIDKVWREWQQRSGGNEFSGTQGGRSVSRSSTMAPWGRSAGSVLDTLSRCVKYRNGNGFIVNRDVVMDRAVERQVATPTIAKSQKDAYQLVVAEEKVKNPEAYMTKVKECDALVKSTVEACKMVGFTGEYLASWQKTEGLVQLAYGVDLADVDLVNKPVAAIAAEGKAEKEAIQTGDDSKLKAAKKDDAGVQSPYAVAVVG